MTGLRHFADGETIPGQIHSVSVSLPDIETVIGFESGNAETLKRIQGGYPRFRTHPFVAKLATHIRHHLNLSGEDELILTRSVRSAHAAANFAGVDPTNVFDHFGASGLVLDSQDSRIENVRAFVQHTGRHMTSRHAEELLFAEKLLDSYSPELITETGAEEQICSILCEAYGAREVADVSLHNSGMSAVYDSIVALHTVQCGHGRSVWVQLGWIFFDTVAVLHKGIVDCEHLILESPFDIEALEAIVEERGGELAGIIAEVSSNPLIQTPDIIRLRQLADRAGCALVLDTTIATPYNVNALPWADVVCESLTKYATGSVDVLMGAAIVNAESRFADSLRSGLKNFGERPHFRDSQRVAHRIEGYQERMRIVNANTMEVARFFAESSIVRRTYWAYDEDSANNYEKIQYRPNSPGGLLLLDLTVPIEQVYDGLRCAKGPSFGWEYTMAAPQIFVAHFDLLATAEGREELAAHGLHRDMLRISIGTEDISSILSVFDEAFSIEPA